MTNVVHVIVGLEVGGAELMLSRLVDECSKNFDCQQTIISLKTAGNLGDEIEKTMSGVDVISLLSNIITPLSGYFLPYC